MQCLVVAAAVKAIRVSDGVSTTSAFVKPSRSTAVFVAQDASGSMQIKAKAKPFKISLSDVVSIKECLKWNALSKTT